MRTETLIAAAAIAIASPQLARAETIDVDSTTLLNLAQQTQGGTPGQPFNLGNVATAYEILNLSARNIQTSYADDVSFVLKGWGALDIEDHRWDSPNPSAFTADLTSAYAQGSFLGRQLTLRVGRQEIAAGTARMIQIDGGQVIALLPEGFKLSAYVGSPVSQRFETRSGVTTWNAIGGNFATGGRLGWSLVMPGSPGKGLDLGASVNYVTDGASLVKEELGGDMRLKLIDPLLVTGSIAYSLYDERFAEGVIRAGYTVTKKVLVEADYRYVAPDLFLSRNSILSVFSAEERQEIGGDVQWIAARSLTLTGTYHLLIEPGFAQASPKYYGDSVLARAEWQRGPTDIGGEFFYLDSLVNGYYGGRVFGRYDFGRAFVAADVSGYVFQRNVNGQDGDITGQLTAGYELLRGLSAVVSGQAGATPYLQQTFQFMAKLVYGQTYKKSEVR